jgi:hypothetical protein
MFEEEEEEEDEVDMAWECRSRRIHGHSPGCVEAQYGDRDGRCRSKPPGSWHSPCWRGSRFFKTATTKPACRLEGSKPSMKPGPGVGRGGFPEAPWPMPMPPIRSARRFWVRMARGSRMKTGAKGMSLPSAARIRPPPLVFTLQYVLYLVLELRTIQDHQDHQDLDC